MTVKLIDPHTGAALSRNGASFQSPSGGQFPIVDSIPRFCDPSNYTDSFGKQWNLFARTQIDDPQTGLDFTQRRFFRQTEWDPAELVGLDILEVGSGAGRFSRVILEHTKANLWSVDFSAAVTANMATNGTIAPNRFHLIQASIYEMPFPDDSFDRVFCFGVLQHTPNFEKSVQALIAKAKPGGKIVVDFYARRHFLSKVNAKYLLRPFSKRMDHDRLLKLIDRNVDWLLALSKGMTRVGLGMLTRFLPLAEVRYFPKYLSDKELREWTVLDTFDCYSPEYDNPQWVKDVAKMFERHGARVDFAGYLNVDGAKMAVVRGTKR